MAPNVFLWHSRLYGTYEALHSGFTTKALQDLTGGIVQSFSLNSQDRLLTYQVLNSAVPRSTLLIARLDLGYKKVIQPHLLYPIAGRAQAIILILEGGQVGKK